MIVAISGWKLQEKAEAEVLCFDAQLVKPVAHEQLFELLEARLARPEGV